MPTLKEMQSAQIIDFMDEIERTRAAAGEAALGLAKVGATSAAITGLGAGAAAAGIIGSSAAAAAGAGISGAEIAAGLATISATLLKFSKESILNPVVSFALGSIIAHYVTGQLDLKEARVGTMVEQYKNGDIDFDVFQRELDKAGLNKEAQQGYINQAQREKLAFAGEQKRKAAGQPTLFEQAAKQRELTTGPNLDLLKAVPREFAQRPENLGKEPLAIAREFQAAQQEEATTTAQQESALAAAEGGQEKFMEFIRREFGVVAPDEAFFFKHPELKPARERAFGQLEDAAAAIRTRKKRI